MAWHTLTSSISDGGATFTIEGFPDTSTGSYNGAWDVEYRYTGPAHEVGHDLGFDHQGTYDLLGNLTATYSNGADALHGAMMGTDYDAAGPQVDHRPSRRQPGGRPEPTVLQDDMAIIANTIKTHVGSGDGYANDDGGSTFATAVPLTFTNGNAQATGVIDRLSDVDMYSIHHYRRTLQPRRRAGHARLRGQSSTPARRSI